MKIIVFINSYYIDVPNTLCFPVFANSILELDDSFPGRMSIILLPTLQYTWTTSRQLYMVSHVYEANDLI